MEAALSPASSPPLPHLFRASSPPMEPFLRADGTDLHANGTDLHADGADLHASGTKLARKWMALKRVTDAQPLLQLCCTNE